MHKEKKTKASLQKMRRRKRKGRISSRHVVTTNPLVNNTKKLLMGASRQDK